MGRPRATGADARGYGLGRVRRIIARRASPLTRRDEQQRPGRVAAARAREWQRPGRTERPGLSEFLLSGFDRTYPIFGQAPDSGDYVAPKTNLVRVCSEALIELPAAE